MRALVVLGLLIASTAHSGVLVVGQPAPELDTAVDLAGKPFKLAAYRGKWVVITIGASWCVPCKAELTAWDKLAGETGGRAVFVTLAIDNDIADGKRFHKDLGLRFLVRAYMPEETSGVAGTYAIKMPTTAVIGPDGVVRYIQAGFDKTVAAQESARLEAALQKLLPAPKPPKPSTRTPPPKPSTNTPPKSPPVSPIPPLLLPDSPHVMLWADHFQLAL